MPLENTQPRQPPYRPAYRTDASRRSRRIVLVGAAFALANARAIPCQSTAAPGLSAVPAGWRAAVMDDRAGVRAMFALGAVEQLSADSVRSFVRWDYRKPVLLENPSRAIDHSIMRITVNCRTHEFRLTSWVDYQDRRGVRAARFTREQPTAATPISAPLFTDHRAQSVASALCTAGPAHVPR